MFVKQLPKLLPILPLVIAFNAPPGVDKWCGKAYQNTVSSFDPGGWTSSPPYSKDPLLDLRFRPRMNIYTSDDEYASFIVDAPISHLLGQPYCSSPCSRGDQFKTLIVDIENAETGNFLISNQKIVVNTTSNELKFALASLAPRKRPYMITLHGKSEDKKQSYKLQTQLYRLPKNPVAQASTVILDSLYGSLLVPNIQSGSAASNASSALLTPIFPYSFYTQWPYFKDKPGHVQAFKSQGYNIVHIVPDSSLPNGFEPEALETFLKACDEVGLWVMYDMRYTYQNHTSVQYQVSKVKEHPSLLLWYTADEPDGTSDPLNATTATYDLIHSIDPYHPISLVLNCHDYHYSSYAAGADIILEDPYPIGNNLSYSTEWHTPCNRTYGDCGCDDCHDQGGFQDISTRLDRLRDYQSWISEAPPKPRWGVPQAFGKEEYWPRYPTAQEETVMTLLSVNHGAKGIVMWTYPTSTELARITSELGPLLAGEQVSTFTLGGDPLPTVVRGVGLDDADAAVWKIGKKLLISVVSLSRRSVRNKLELELPWKITSVAAPLLGKSWEVSGGTLVKTGLEGLECDLFVATLA